MEGEERYTLSLVSADNNADISPTNPSVTIIILPDPGSSGKVGISAPSRKVYIGEPTASYDGKAYINVTRGTGKFGNIKITWQITVRDNNFVQNQGELVLLDGQRDATIVIQVSIRL